jgi:hypothetical protein
MKELLQMLHDDPRTDGKSRRELHSLLSDFIPPAPSRR